MRGYTVVVNGKSYNVDIMERDGAPAVTYAPVAAAPVAAAPVAAAPVAAAPAPVAAPAAAGQERVEAPLPGTVLQIMVKVGDAVKPGDTLCTLEAMKMENEIVAPIAGTIVQMAAEKGAAVTTGDLLAVIG